jgi:hypothetical protein
VTDLPPDSNLDDLPDELREREGPFVVRAQYRLLTKPPLISGVSFLGGERRSGFVRFGPDSALGLRFDAAWPLVGLRREVVLQAASTACETLAPNRGREESHVSW